MQLQSETFDAIVVGSGISGGWAAKELTERGLRVLMLERGKNIEHIKDYGNALKAPWEYPHRGGRTLAMEEAYPVLKRDYPLNEKNLDWWASDKDSPYTEIKRFDWYRGYHVGGRSLLWGRQSYRLGDLDFEANAREGIAVDWPIRYRDVAPWYDHVERHAGISGSREGLAATPRRPVPAGHAAQLRRGDHRRSRRIEVWWTTNHPGTCCEPDAEPPGTRGVSGTRNACWLGCPFGAYFSTQSSTLPPARATGRLTLKTFAIVTDLVYDRDRKRARSVRVLDAVTGQTTEYSARVIFLCASTLNSTWILMRSATDVWPGGLGSSSGELGHNLMDHHFRCGANGDFAGHEDRYVFGRRPTGFYIPRFRNLAGERRDYLRGFGYQGSASRQGWERAVAELGVGGAFKDAMAQPGPWRVGATAFGEMLPNHANRISIDTARMDKWGLPVLAIDCATGENERLMRRDMMNDMAEMLEAAGATDVQCLRQRLCARHGHSRNGDGADGPRPEDVGAERPQSGVGLSERVRDRRRVHDLVGLPEPVVDVHGTHRSCGRLRRRGVEAWQSLTRSPAAKRCSV